MGAVSRETRPSARISPVMILGCLLYTSGDEVNVERSMMMNGRLDGHIVQGHVDQTATCIDIKDAEVIYYFTFRDVYKRQVQKRPIPLGGSFEGWHVTTLLVLLQSFRWP